MNTNRKCFIARSKELTIGLYATFAATAMELAGRSSP